MSGEMMEYEASSKSDGTKLITLPDDKHKLYCWKVRQGTDVRIGVTVALAVKKGDANAENQGEEGMGAVAATAGNPQHQYKRPTKRRRPVASSSMTMTTTTDGGVKPVSDASSKAGTLSTCSADTKANPSSTGKVVSSKPDFVPIVARMDGILRIGAPVGCKDSLVKGYIEVCPHPTILAGLCAVCGKSIKSKSNSSGEDDDQQGEAEKAPSGMSQMTVSGGITVTVSEKEGQLIAQQDAERLRKLRKLSLVLDLDHTLVHATWDVRAREHLPHEDVRSLLLPVPVMEGDVQRELRMQHFLKLRPHVREFLSKTQTCYEIGVYTAGTREYAEQVTLILARHLVGSNRDEIDLEQLRQKVLLTEAEVRRSKLSSEHNSLQDGNVTGSSESAKHRRYDLSSPDEHSILRNGPEKGASSAVNGSQKLSKDEPEPISESESARAESRQELESSIDEIVASTFQLAGTDTKPEKNSSQLLGEEEATTQSDSNTQPNDSVAPAEKSSEKESKPLRKRKRVTFGDPPSSCRSSGVSDHDLENLRKELAEAEHLESMAMDMRRRLFGSRVVSRTDVGDLGRDVKSLKRIFPCGGTMAAVVDDREDVWANAQDQACSGRPGEPPDNLLLVRPYHWDTFLGFVDVNNASGIDLSMGADAKSRPSGQSSEQDQQLLWTTDILLRLHQRYYEHNGDDRPSVPQILAAMRREVLQGCNVVLSGLIPLHKQNASVDLDRPRPPILRYVENLGGRVLTSVTRETTHVVGAKDGTDKIIAARKVPGSLVVKPLWLMECVWSLTRRNEIQHLLGPAPMTAPSSSLRPLVDSKRDNTSSSSDEDDELAAGLEKEFL